jgi:hypothetical protein
MIEIWELSNFKCNLPERSRIDSWNISLVCDVLTTTLNRTNSELHAQLQASQQLVKTCSNSEIEAIAFEFIYGRHVREIPETYLGRLVISCLSDAFIGQ